MQLDDILAGITMRCGPEPEVGVERRAETGKSNLAGVAAPDGERGLGVHQEALHGDGLGRWAAQAHDRPCAGLGARTAQRLCHDNRRSFLCLHRIHYLPCPASNRPP